MDQLILSPHLDDAWFDLGGSITRWRSAGESVSVIDVFSIQGWMRFETLPSQLVTSIRKREEEKNAQRDGVALDYLDVPEGAIRGYNLVFPQTIDWSRDRVTLRHILKLLPERMHFKNAKHIYFPLGIGGNVDHLLLREAAITLGQMILGRGGSIGFYECFTLGQERSTSSGTTGGKGPHVLYCGRRGYVGLRSKRQKLDWYAGGIRR